MPRGGRKGGRGGRGVQAKDNGREVKVPSFPSSNAQRGRVQLIKEYLQGRLQQAQDSAAACSSEQHLLPGASRGAAALRLLAPEARVPLAALPQAIRAAKERGSLQSSQVVRLLESVSLLEQHGPVAYQPLGASMPIKGVHVERGACYDSALFDEDLLARRLAGPRLVEQVARHHEDGSTAVGVLREAAERVGLSWQDVASRGAGAAGLFGEPLPPVNSLQRVEERGHAAAPRDELLARQQLICLAEKLWEDFQNTRQKHAAEGSAAARADAARAAREPWASLSDVAEALFYLEQPADAVVTVVAPNFIPPLARGNTLISSFPAQETFFGALLRGHLLMQLVHRAWEEKLEGNCAALQDLVRPLQAACTEPSLPSRRLIELAPLLLGLPTGPTIALASALLEVVHVREGGFERQMLLTLHLLSLEPRMPCSPCGVAHAGAGDGDTEEELSGADGALGDEHAATDSGWGEAWSAAAAARAAQRVAPRQSQLAARILLALHRLQARRRLPAFLVDAILKWMLPQLGDQARLPTAGDADVEPAVLDRLALLPPDSLLALYTLVAIVFGGAFRVPEDLGAPPPSQHAGRWDVGAADFARAAVTAARGLSWREAAAGAERRPPGAAPPDDGGTASSLACLGVSAFAVQSGLHQEQANPAEPQGVAVVPPEAHVLPGYCAACNAFAAAQSTPDACLDVLARLAARSCRMPAALGQQTSVAAYDRLKAGQPLLIRGSTQQLRIGATPEEAMSMLDILCFACATFSALLERVEEAHGKNKEAFDRLEDIPRFIAKSLQESAQPVIAFASAEDAAKAITALEQCAEIYRDMVVAMCLMRKLELLKTEVELARLKRMQARLLTERSPVQPEARHGVAAMVDSYTAIQQQQKGDVDRLQGSLELPAQELCPWATSALQLLRAQQAQGGVPFLPPQALHIAALGTQKIRQDIRRLVAQLSAGTSMLRWQVLDLVSQLRQACTVQLAAPLEEFVAQEVLGTTWGQQAAAAVEAREHAEAQAAAREAAAEAQKAETAALALLAEEEEELAAQQRKQKKEEKRRAAKARQQQQREEERARRQQEEEETKAAQRQLQHREEEDEARLPCGGQQQADLAVPAKRDQHGEVDAAAVGQDRVAGQAESPFLEQSSERSPPQQQRALPQQQRASPQQPQQRQREGSQQQAAQGEGRLLADRLQPLLQPQQQTPQGRHSDGYAHQGEGQLFAAGSVAAGQQSSSSYSNGRSRSKGAQAMQPTAGAGGSPGHAPFSGPLMSSRQQLGVPEQLSAVSEAPQRQQDDSGCQLSWATVTKQHNKAAAVQPRPAAKADGARSSGGDAPGVADGACRSGSAAGSQPHHAPVAGRRRAARRAAAFPEPLAAVPASPPATAAAGEPAADPPAAAATIPAATAAATGGAAGEAESAFRARATAAAAPVVAAAAGSFPAVQAAPTPPAAQPSWGPDPVQPSECPDLAAVDEAELKLALAGLGLGADGSRDSSPQPAAGLASAAAATSLRSSEEAGQDPAVVPAAPPAGPPPGSWAARVAKRPGLAALRSAAAPAAPAGQQVPAGSGWSFASEQGSPPRVPTPEIVPAEGAAAARAAGETLPLRQRCATATRGGAERSKGPSLALPGLRNEAGDFNCFLNVVLQCLWRCADFRRQVLSWPSEVYCADPVLHSFAALFQELTRADVVAAASSVVEQQHVVIDPTPLREAINGLPGQEFKLGEMSDAGELLLVLFEHMKGVAPAVAGAAVDAVFGLRVAEAVACHMCGRETQQSSYTQYFFNAFAAALRSSLAAGPDPGFGARLRRIEDEHKKSCDTDVGGCGTLHPVRQELEGEPPRVFTLQLVWESHEEEPATIGATLRAVAEQIDLGQLYADLMPGTLYRLRAMVCYYGRHYSAFVHLPQLSRWVTFDDSSAGSIGAWYDVRMRCESGRVQPSVLLYEAVS